MHMTFENSCIIHSLVMQNFLNIETQGNEYRHFDFEAGAGAVLPLLN